MIVVLYRKPLFSTRLNAYAADIVHIRRLCVSSGSGHHRNHLLSPEVAQFCARGFAEAQSVFSSTSMHMHGGSFPNRKGVNVMLMALQI